MIPLTSRILQPNWHVLYQWTGREEEQILGFFFIIIFLYCWFYELAGTICLRELGNQEPEWFPGWLCLSRHSPWSCLWNRASRSAQMGWVVMKETFRKGRKEGGGSWVKKRKRCVFFSQLYFFKIREKKKKKKKGEQKKGTIKRKIKAPTQNNNNNNKSHPKPTKLPIQKCPNRSIDPIHPFQRQAGALILPLTKLHGHRRADPLSAASSQRAATNREGQEDLF